MSLTATAISGPMPSPSIRLTVYLPCDNCQPVLRCAAMPHAAATPHVYLSDFPDRGGGHGQSHEAGGLLTLESFWPLNLATASE